MQQERIDIEEKYANLQEEAAGKTKKLKKVWSMLMSAKSEVSQGKNNLFSSDNSGFQNLGRGEEASAKFG